MLWPFNRRTPCYFGGVPAVSKPPPPPPTLQQPNITAAGLQQEQAAKGAKGASADIKTGPQGLGADANVADKTLLG